MTKIYLLLFFSFYSVLTNGQPVAYISTENAKSDLSYMVSTIQDVHYNAYFKTDQTVFEYYQDSVLSQWDTDSISVREFTLVGMQLSALMSGGHTGLYWKNSQLFPELKSFEYIPFTGKLNDAGEFEVTRSANEIVDETTAIEAINGIPIIELYKETMTCIGGIYSYKNSYCESVFPLYLFFTDKIKAPYLLTLKGGKQVTLEGMKIRPLFRYLNEQNSRKKYTFEILDGNIGYLQYNQCVNYKAFDHFLKHTFQSIEKNGVDRLIIDIRENGGGNSNLNDLLLNYITRKPYQQAYGRYWKVSEQVKEQIQTNSLWKGFVSEDFSQQYLNSENQSIIKEFDDTLTYPDSSDLFFKGTTCVLIGPKTFSSANYLADAVKTYGLSTLIGLPTGEYTNDFGELIGFKLPNSGSRFYVSSTYDIGANKNFEILTPVIPDILAEFDPLKVAIEWFASPEVQPVSK